MRILLTLSLVFTAWGLQADSWPKVIKHDNSEITIYQPQHDSLVGDELYGMAAISYEANGKKPVFGAAWFVATLSTDRSSRMTSIQRVNVYDVRFPPSADLKIDTDKASEIVTNELPNWRLAFSMDELVTSLEAQNKVANEGFNDSPPEIIYRTEPTALVIVDGDPIWEDLPETNIRRCVNSPSLIMEYKKRYYLMGNGLWYESDNLNDWSLSEKPPKDVTTVYEKMVTDEAQSEMEASKPEVPPDIVLRTTPAELVQTDGEANLVPISGTNLLYISNSESDILFDINKQEYYLLISGRWFVSENLDGPWAFMPPSELPSDFGKIPEGNAKDEVLANVPGTHANKEAIMDAQVPQTASIDRSTATTDVQYDGKPQFEDIEETNLKYAQNADKQVIEDNGRYYCVDDGIWYESESPDGPWFACTQRPMDVEKIPASHPAYNVRYVYIYDYTPNYVYCGYVPGYTGCYIYGGIPVYGTGWYYRPWYYRYYYPRPCTWGFNMSYNPWYGFSMGMNVSCGGPYFNFNIHFGSRGYYPGWGGGYYGGWFGCHNYRPPYHPPYGGWYGGGRPVINIDNSTNININNKNNTINRVTRENNIGNLYANNGWGGSNQLGNLKANRANTKDRMAARPGVAQTGARPVSKDQANKAIANRPRPGVQKPATRPGIDRPNSGVAPNLDKSKVPQRPQTRPTTRPSEKPAARPQTRPAERPATRPEARPVPQTPPKSKDIYADPAGNVYQKSKDKYKQVRPTGSGWQKPETRPSTGPVNGRNLNRDAMARQRASQRVQSYQSRPSANRAAAPRSMPRRK